MQVGPPMEPDTDEASERQLDRAREQGRAYRRALDLMVGEIAQNGGTVTVDDYLVGYAIEEAEGLYSLRDGDLVWNEPDDENTHIEIVVCDAADGRFIPGLDVSLTVTADDGTEVGTHEHGLVWHPMMYHYARNWVMPRAGTYSLTVEFDAPGFHRHDRVNGRRFTRPCRVTFDGVEIDTGQD